MDTSNIVFVDDKDLLATSSKTHKKGKSSSKKASTGAKAASPSQELEIVELTPSPKASSKKASTHAKAASPSQELEIVELTPSPKASSKKASTHAKAASDLEIVELSPSPQKKQSLSFGQQVAAKLLEQQSKKSKELPAFKPAVFQSLPKKKPTPAEEHRELLKQLHKSMVEPKGRAVSPTFKPHDPKHGDWM